MKLSVIVVTYDMPRVLPRTLQSLQTSYQLEGDSIDYEVIVIDNGSPKPPTPSEITKFGHQFKYYPLENPPPSPAFALNYGVKKASGDHICLMVDGAHLLTPGLLSKATACFRAMPNAVVITRYFYLGPGEQNDTILNGYNEEQEDKLLEKIDWPNMGYRLFEIGVPQVFKDFPNYTWFYAALESNCLFMSKANFLDIGGADEQFDIAGGGFMNIDLYKRICDYEKSQPVMLIGEGSFHQLHGGTTTNVPPDEQSRRVEIYQDQYRQLRSEDLKPINKKLFYFGNFPTAASKIQRLNAKKNKNQ
ncbi:MAG: glycosyltransferase [Luminiphilus sp.]|nr:glycosyltransferase [Luminiphilus sp.]